METCQCGTTLQPDPEPYRAWCPKCRMQVRTLARLFIFER